MSASNGHTPDLPDAVRAAVEEVLRKAEELGVVQGAQLPEAIAGLLRQGESGDTLRTDFGAARVFAHTFARQVIFANGRGWYVWDGKRWVEDVHNAAVTILISRISDAYLEAAHYYAAKQQGEEAKRYFTFGLKLRSSAKVGAVLELASKQPGIFHPTDPFDHDPWALNVQNGILDLRTGKLRPHDPDAFCSRICNVAYDPSAKAGRWRQFLNEVFNGDGEMVRFVRRWLGYTLTGDTREQKLVIAWGGGRNGKTTLFETVRYILGDYATSLKVEVLTPRRDGGDHANPSLAQLPGVRMVIVPEWVRGRQVDEVLLKSLVGGDTIPARKLFREPFQFKPSFKLAVYGNAKPEFRGRDEGTWRRILLVPFVVSFAGREDTSLPIALREEAAGILTDLAQACLEWQHEGLGIPRTVKAATAGYRAELDDVTEFLASECVRDDAGSTTVGQLFAAYKEWGGELSTPQAMGRAMRELGFTTHKSKQGVTVHGLRLAAQ